jgi:hypothetical protein
MNTLEEPVLNEVLDSVEQPTPFLIPLGNDDYELHVDNSAKELFESCARASEYYNVWRRQSIGERASLFRGSVIHHALAIRRTRHLLPVPETWEAEQIAYVINAYADKDFGPDEWRTAEHAVNSIIEYNKAWPIDTEPFTVYDGSVEKAFKLELGKAELDSKVTTYAGSFHVRNVYLYWTGIIDAEILYGCDLVMDSKTTSILGTQFWDNFQLDSQMLSYVWANRKLGGDAAGAYVDAVCGRKPTKSGKAHEYQRQRFFYDQAQLDEWEKDTYTLITDFLEHLCRGYFPKSPKWCFGKYGRCQYWDICSQTPDSRESVLQSDMYRPVTWNPLTVKRGL